MKYNKSMAQILREMNEATFQDDFFDANKPMSKIQADARKFGIKIKVKKGGGQMGADLATLTGPEQNIIKYAKARLDADKKVRNLRDLKKSLHGEAVDPEGERIRGRKISQLNDPVKIHGKDKDDDEKTDKDDDEKANEDAVATAQKRLDKAKKIADLKKQITTIRNEQISESVGDDAKRLGLTHLGFGRYGKDGKMTHKSDGDKLVKAEPKDIEDYEKKQKAQDDEPTKDEPKQDKPKPSKDPDSVGGANDPNAGRGRIKIPGSNKPLDRQVNKFFGDEDQIKKEFEDIVDIGRGSNSVFYHGNGTTEITISGTPPGMDDDDAGDLGLEYDNIVGKLEAKGLEMGKDFFIDELEKPDPESDDDIIIAAMKIRVIPDLSDFESDEERSKFRAKWIEANKKYDYFAKTMGGRQLSFRNTDGNESEKNPNMENEEMNHYVTAISKMNEAPVAQKKEDLDDKDVDTIKPIIKQLKKSVKAHDKQAKQLQKDIEDETDLEELTDKQIARLKKEYEQFRGKDRVSPEKFNRLRGIMKRFTKPQLLKVAKADIPIISSGAKASLVLDYGMKYASIPEDFIPYIEVFADDNKELSEQKKSNFKSVDPKVIDRIEKMMRGTRKEKDSIANMLNYFMPPEVVDMVRYKLKIVPKRGKIKF